LPVEIARYVWSELPLLLALNLVLIVGTIPFLVLLLGGFSLVAPLVAALTFGPLWAGTVAVTDGIVHDNPASFRVFLRNVRRYAKRGMAVSLVPAAVMTTLLGTLAVLAVNPDERWLLLPLLADGSVAILVFLAGFSVFTFATTYGLRGVTLWKASLTTAATGPMVTLGTVALLLLLVWLIKWAGPAVVLALPAPFAVYLSATTRFTVQRRARRGEQELEKKPAT